MTLLEFFVDGEPRAKQSFRVGGAGRGGHGFTPARTKAWQTDVGWIARQKMHEHGWVEPFLARLSVSLTFQLPDRRRVDLDNLSKAALDAMQGIVYENDDNVMVLHLRKVRACETPGMHVLVQLLEDQIQEQS